MTSYRLDQLDRGVIQLRSGPWRWFVVRLHSLPEGTCELQHLIFANESGAGDTMRARVQPDVDEVSDKDVLEYARHPEERSFRTSAGRFLIRQPRATGFDRMWHVRPERGHPYDTNKHIERSLGELTAQELEDIAASRL